MVCPELWVAWMAEGLVVFRHVVLLYVNLLETAAATAVSDVHLLAIEELVLLSLVPRLRSQLLAADEMVCPELEVALLAEGLVVFQLVLLEVLVVPHHSKVHPATHPATPPATTHPAGHLATHPANPFSPATPPAKPS